MAYPTAATSPSGASSHTRLSSAVLLVRSGWQVTKTFTGEREGFTLNDITHPEKTNALYLFNLPD